MIKSKNKLIKMLTLCLVLVMTTTAFVGCGRQGGASGTPTASAAATTAAAAATAAPDANKTGDPVVISVGLLSEDIEFFQNMIEEEGFKQVLPNTTVDFQQYKNTEDMISNQKIRQAANELPDIIYMKPDHVLELKDSLLTWSPEDELVKKNLYVDSYDINKTADGGYVGIPMKTFSDWVFYRPSVFEALDLSIPTTWQEFVDLALAIKADGKYIPIAMGAKDTWPTYPFNEFMPHVVSGNQNILSDIAKQDEPFGPDSAFYKAYEMVDVLYKADVMGDALGTGWAESEQLMASGKAAMMVVGQYFLPDYKKLGGDMADIAVFPLPTNTEKVQTIQTVGLVDLFFGISVNSKHVDEAKSYLNYFFSPDTYKKYIEERNMTSTIEGVEASSIFTDAMNTYDMETFMYVPGDENYSKLYSETQWETKTIGAMMLAGMDFKEILADYNKKWKTAREKLGMQ